MAGEIMMGGTHLDPAFIRRGGGKCFHEDVQCFHEDVQCSSE